MSFTIAFDYRFDSTGFFSDPVRRAALEAAGDAWESVIGDEFADIPAGTRFSVLNPGTRGNTETVTTVQAIDDLVVFVGAMDIGSLGIAGPDGFDADGDVLASRISSDFRGQGPVTDFEPWAGTITFDSTAAWSFDLAGPVAGRDDFLSVAIHEIGHVLGIGTSGAFDALVTWGQFTGANAVAVNGGSPVPLHSDDSHVKEDYAGGDVVMDPTLTSGNRKLPSDIDKAILADIGYRLAGFTPQGSQPEIATGNGEIIFGTVHADTIDGLGGNDQIQGNDGDDTLLGGAGADTLFGERGNDRLDGGADDDQLQGGDGDDILHGGAGTDQLWGQGGVDTFVIGPGDGRNVVNDFDPGGELIRLIDSGFAAVSDALSAITKPYSNVSRLTLFDGTSIDVFHDTQSGTPLTASNFELADSFVNSPPGGSVAIAGTADEGETLTADTSTLVDADGLGVFSYTWLRDETAIGATGASYTLVAADVGAAMSVRVEYLDGHGTQESVTSAATEPVAAAGRAITGDAGDNRLQGTWGDDVLDGGEGVDTGVYSGNQASYTLTLGPDGTVLTDRRGDGNGADRLVSIEFLDFDQEIPEMNGAPLDLVRHGGPASLDAAVFDEFIELYIAYFNRAPDALGLFFWATAYANGYSLEELAELFSLGAEFKLTYPDGTSNLDFATGVYNNVLGRTPDRDGLDFWVGVLDAGDIDRDAFLLKVIQGAKMDPAPGSSDEFVAQQLADRAYLATKTDIGAYFAVHKGMSDTGHAASAIAHFDGSDAGRDAAVAAIDGYYAEALDPENGAFLMQLVGVIDDPFAA